MHSTMTTVYEARTHIVRPVLALLQCTLNIFILCFSLKVLQYLPYNVENYQDIFFLKCMTVCCCGLNCIPQKVCSGPKPRHPVNVTLFGNRVFTGVIRFRGGHVGLGWALMHWSSCKMRGIWMWTHEGRNVVWRTTSPGPPRVASSHQKLGRGKEGAIRWSPRISWLAAWLGTSSLELWRLRNKRSSLWYFVIAAMGNQYIVVRIWFKEKFRPDKAKWSKQNILGTGHTSSDSPWFQWSMRWLAVREIT